MTVQQRALPRGSIVYDRYRIEKTLGEGGFGITYQVTDLRQQQIYAMKEFFPIDMAVRDSRTGMVLPRQEKAVSFSQFRDKFLEEARLIYHYQGHSSIVNVVHLIRFNNTAYYVMEYIPGRDLKQQLDLRGGSLPWAELQPILAQVVSALQAVHRDNIVHCDISPDNIFVLDDGGVKLIDFGAAKGALHSDSGVVLMKRGYTPPEQLARNGRIGPWTDIYALAATIYRCTTGQLPPSSEDRLQEDRTLWPSQLQIPVPSMQWEQTLKRAMALDPDRRYQQVDTFWQELTHAAGPTARYALEGIQGYFSGQRIPIDGSLTLGRDPGLCQILYPGDAPGVSNRHLRVWTEGSELFVMDLGSSYGTWLGSRKLPKGLCCSLRPSDTLFFGASQMFRVVLLG